MSLILSSFKQGLKYAPHVLKDLSIYFAGYFFVFSFIVLWLFKFLSSADTFSPNILHTALLAIASLFTAFIVPYYAFKYSKGSVPKFWDFIRDNIWPLIFAYIKAFFVVLLFLILLILPGIYKGIRFSFLTETVLFDKKASKSMLKQADSNTRGYFWQIILFLIVSGIFGFILKMILKTTSAFLGSHMFIIWINLILAFYIQCFVLLWKTHFFFEIKNKKGEEISC